MGTDHVRMKQTVLCYSLAKALAMCKRVSSQHAIQTLLIQLLQHNNKKFSAEILTFLRFIDLADPIPALVETMLQLMRRKSNVVRHLASDVLQKIVEKPVTNEVISELARALNDQHDYVKRSACGALRRLGKRAATNDSVAELRRALINDQDDVFRSGVYLALYNMGEMVNRDEFFGHFTRDRIIEVCRRTKHMSGGIIECFLESSLWGGPDCREVTSGDVQITSREQL